MSRRATFTTIAVAVALSCHGGDAPPQTPPLAKPPNGGPDAGADRTAAKSDSWTELLVEPKYAKVRTLIASDRRAEAAEAFEKLRLQAGADDARSCELAYASARLYRAAADEALAAERFGEAAKSSGCPLAKRASYERGVSLFESGAYDAVEASARAAEDDALLVSRARRLRERALWKGPDTAKAAAASLELLEASPNDGYWMVRTVTLAKAWLHPAVPDPTSHAARAFDGLTRVMVEAPVYADKNDVADLRRRAYEALSPDDKKNRALHLSREGEKKRADSYLAAGKAQEAYDAASAWLKSASRAPSVDSCAVALTKARASVRLRRRKDDEWADALRACTGSPEMPIALFGAAKLSAQRGRSDEALSRYRTIETQFASHRLADDARLRWALLKKDAGDDKAFTDALTSLPDTYPAGDMGQDALFRVVLHHLEKDTFASAGPVLTKLESSVGDGREEDPGRVAYYQALLVERSGDRAAAMDRYESVIAKHPLRYYMAMALARLRHLDAARADRVERSLLARANTKAAERLLGDASREALSAPRARIARALHLAGDDAGALEELDRARTDLGADRIKDPSIGWAFGWMYVQVNHPEQTVRMARHALRDYAEHYPSGKWLEAWRLAYPRAFEAMVMAESRKNGIDPILAWAIMREESNFVPDAISPANAYGLMQLIIPTARLVAKGTELAPTEDSLKTPAGNIPLGTKLLSQLTTEFHANPALSIAAYNAGAGAVRRWLSERRERDFDFFVESIPYTETRAYIKRVLATRCAYGFLDSRSDRFAGCRVPVATWQVNGH